MEYIKEGMVGIGRRVVAQGWGNKDLGGNFVGLGCYREEDGGQGVRTGPDVALRRGIDGLGLWFRHLLFLRVCAERGVAKGCALGEIGSLACPKLGTCGRTDSVREG